MKDADAVKDADADQCKRTHRENSPVTQTSPEPTLLSWGGGPCSFEAQAIQVVHESGLPIIFDDFRLLGAGFCCF